MIEISEPLPQSEAGATTIHDVLSGGKRIGYVEVEYVQKDDFKTFQKYTKRKLFVGQPYVTRIFIDVKGAGTTVNALGKSGLSEIVSAVKEKFRGLEDRDIYILELTDAGKNRVCRASEL